MGAFLPGFVALRMAVPAERVRVFEGLLGAIREVQYSYFLVIMTGPAGFAAEAKFIMILQRPGVTSQTLKGAFPVRCSKNGEREKEEAKHGNG